MLRYPVRSFLRSCFKGWFLLPFMRMRCCVNPTAAAPTPIANKDQSVFRLLQFFKKPNIPFIPIPPP